MKAMLGLIVGLLAVSQVGFAADHGLRSSQKKEVRGPGASLGFVTLIRISAIVDGSDQFIFTHRSVRWVHKFWSDPTDVTFDGKPWTDLRHSPPGWQELNRDLDLSRAWVVKRQGRDVVALERTANGFDLYFCDSPNESGYYEAVIAVPRRVGPGSVVPARGSLVAWARGFIPAQVQPVFGNVYAAALDHRGEVREDGEEHGKHPGGARGGWEYKVLVTAAGMVTLDAHHHQVTCVENDINTMTQKGWQLVSVSTGGSNATIVEVFKRHK